MSTLVHPREDNSVLVMKNSAIKPHAEWGYYRPPTTMWPRTAVRGHHRPALQGVNMDERKLKVLISEERLQARIQELGKEIRKHYGDECITCIGVLKGSFMFMADLVRAIGEMCAVSFWAFPLTKAGPSPQVSSALPKTFEIN